MIPTDKSAEKFERQMNLLALQFPMVLHKFHKSFGTKNLPVIQPTKKLLSPRN